MSGTPAGGPRIAGTVLDHVAHAVHRWQDVWDRYASDLGAVWASGGPGPGFAPGQVRFANGARVEMLMPWDVGVNDFLARFLASHGPGPHHLTFKVPRPGRRHRGGPARRDRAGRGSTLPIPSGRRRSSCRSTPPAPWSSWPRPRTPGAVHRPTGIRPSRGSARDGSGPAAPATLERVCHVVDDLDAAAALFCGLLDGESVIRRPRAASAGWTCGGPVRSASGWLAAVDPEAPGPVAGLAVRPTRPDPPRGSGDRGARRVFPA